MTSCTLEVDALRKETIIYEVTLIELLKMYDLTGNGEMMKHVLVSGKGLLKPKESDTVKCTDLYKISQCESTIWE